jgi:hypothetical protein
VSTRLLPNLSNPLSSLLSKKKSQDLLAVRHLLATSTHVRRTLRRNVRLVRGPARTVIAPRRSWTTKDGSADRSDDPTCVPIVVSRHDPISGEERRKLKKYHASLVLVTAPLFPVETAKSKEATPPPFQDVASPDSTFSEDGPAPASTSLAAPTPSPVVHRPSEVQSPRVPLTPSRPGVALQRVTSGSVSAMCESLSSTKPDRTFHLLCVLQ